jgi:hypothetical protein
VLVGAITTEALLIGLATALAGALGTYIVARRRMSGSIKTSEATSLWEESQAMRKELRDELVATRDELKACQDELDQLRETEPDGDGQPDDDTTTVEGGGSFA